MKLCIDWAQFLSKVSIFLGPVNWLLWAFTEFLDAFLSKFGMPPIMKVVFLEISNNFCIGQFSSCYSKI